jgi:branched-chain amino acid aminotransferase
MDCPYDYNDFVSALKEVILANNYEEDVAVRQTVFIEGDGSWFSKGPVGMFVAPITKARRNVDEHQAISCKVSSWERITERSMSPRTKSGANYINSRMAQLEAIECGFDSAIMLNNAGKVAEGPGSCLFLVRDGVLITPNINSSILESITRDTLMILAGDLGIPVQEREVERTELYIADEVFLCGSAMEIQSVNNIDGHKIGNLNIGNITRRLLIAYQKTFSGCDSNHIDWLTSIYDCEV